MKNLDKKTVIRGILFAIALILLIELFSVGISAIVSKHQNKDTFWGGMFFNNQPIFGRIFAIISFFFIMVISIRLTKKENQQ